MGGTDTSGRIRSYAWLAARVRRQPPRAGSTRVVAVDGPAGAGKTSVAARLADRVRAPVVAMDDLYPGWEGLQAAVPRLVTEVLTPLGTGQAARYRRWSWERSRYASWVEVPPADVLVVEGCGSGSLDAAPYLSLLVWVEAPETERYARAMARDGDTFRPYWDRWAAQEEEHFTADATRARADVVVDGAPTVPHDPETEVVVRTQG